MSLIAEFSVAHDGLTMAEALSAVPDMELELIQEVATDPQRPLLYVWASGGDVETFEGALEDDPTVTDVQRYNEDGDKVLYRAQITEAAEVVSYPVWVEAGGEQLDARYRDGRWHVRMRFPDRDALQTVRDWCDGVDMRFDFRGLYTDVGAGERTTGLTDAQRAALVAAYEGGFFAVPREQTMHDIADEMGLSDQAFSERVRRGVSRLVETLRY